MASQDKTPTPPTPAGGPAGTDSGREATGFSDASETIVGAGSVSDAPGSPAASGTHDGAGTVAAGHGAAGTDATDATDASVRQAPADEGPVDPQELSDEDWDREFLLAAGGQEAAEGSARDAVPAQAAPAVERETEVLDETDPYNSDPDAVDPSTIVMPAAGSAGAAAGAGSAGRPDREPVENKPADSKPVDGDSADTAAVRTRSRGTGVQDTGSEDSNPFPWATGAGSAAPTDTKPAGTGGATAALPVPAAGTGAAAQAEQVQEKAGRGRKGGRGKGAAVPAVAADAAASEELTQSEALRRAQEREKAAAAKPVLARVLQVMIAVFFPVMLIAAAIRAVATPLFLWIEYHRPGFPADTYGFSTDDRMTYGSYAVDYILNWSGARYLGDLVTPNGEPLYLASEVSHMADVKGVLSTVFIVATVMALLTLIGCLYLARRSPGGIRRAFFSGALVTLVLGAGLVVLAVLGWETFFTQVHQVFFAQGNWTFRLDDTLIRLFPAQFWMDAGIVIAALTLLVSLVVLIAAWPTKARRERSRLARENARRRYLESLEAL